MLIALDKNTILAVTLMTNLPLMKHWILDSVQKYKYQPTKPIYFELDHVVIMATNQADTR